VKTKLDDETTANGCKPMSRSEFSLDFGNGVRPQRALGVKDPIWRLGALVSLLHSNGKVILVQKPDRSLSLRACKPHAIAGNTFLKRELARLAAELAPVSRSLPPELIEPTTRGLKPTGIFGSARRLNDRAEEHARLVDGIASKARNINLLRRPSTETNLSI